MPPQRAELKAPFLNNYTISNPAIYVVAALIIAQVACKPQPKEAADYNNKIISEQDSIVLKFRALEQTLNEYDPLAMDIAFFEANEQVDTSIIVIKSMPAFDNKTDYKDSALEVFSMYKSLLDNEYKEVVTILKKSELDYTKEDEERVRYLLFSVINEKLDNAYENIIAIQTAFAEKYKITLKGKPQTKR